MVAQFALKKIGEGIVKGEVVYMKRVFSNYVYENPMVQAFFEFSLLSAFIYPKKVDLPHLKKQFLIATKKSLETPLNYKAGQKIDELLRTYEAKGYFNKKEIFNPAGRPKGRISQKTEEILELNKQGKSNLEIAKILYPNFRYYKLKQQTASIGRILRDSRAFSRNPQNKTTKN